MKQPNLQGCDGLLKLFLHPGDFFIASTSWKLEMNQIFMPEFYKISENGMPKKRIKQIQCFLFKH